MSDSVLTDERAVATGAPARARWLDRPLASLLAWNGEALLWGALVLVTLLLRLYDLGVRGMSHDESLHTLYSYYLFNEGRYEHNPMMHGPFRYHVTALVYFLFGASDFSSRLVPALLGTSLVGLLYAFRRWIGRTGAFVAALLVTVSPSLLFHSRYIRDDIFIATLTTLWALCAFRYLETRRYRWLLGMVLAMAFSFATMENSFITGAIFGAFFVLLALYQAIEWRVFVAVMPILPLGLVSYYYHYLDRDDIAVPLIAVGLALTVALAVFYLARVQGWRRLRTALPADLAVLMLTLVLPFLGSFLYVILGNEAKVFMENEYLGREIIRQLALLVGVAALIAAGVATFWFLVVHPRGGVGSHADREQTPHDAGHIGLIEWAQLMAIFWAVQVLFFTTFFTNTRNGLASGIVGSLGYWLAQQNVERGSQPWYYYFFVGGLYEFLPIVLTLAGAVTLVRLAFRREAFTPVAASDLPPQPDARTPETAHEVRLWFVVFALFWVVGMWIAYTVAGEKMPWLLTHMALPMCVFGGWWLGRLLHGIDWRAAWRTRAALLVVLVPVVLLMALLFVRSWPAPGREVDAVAGWMRFLLAGVALAGLLYAALRAALAGGRRLASSLAGVGLLALLFVLTVRAGFMLTYVNYDMATEYLVYAHASPDVKRALAEIDSISERTAGDRNIVVAYDDESSWPFSWYMRQYPNARYYGDKPDSHAMSAPVVIVGPKNREKVQPYVERDYAKRTYRLIWWPDMDYFNLNWERIRFALTDPQQRERLLQIALFRRHRDTNDFSRFRDLTQWPARHEFDMWVRKDLAAQIWDLNVTPSAFAAETNPLVSVPDVDLEASSIYNGLYAGVPLAFPRAVAAGSDGRRVIADSGNNRIVVLDSTGTEVAVFGSRCDLGAGAEGGCVDPDGTGPLALGDGQFNEPWGVAVGPSGDIYVADTWNGRIQLFSPEGEFRTKWGISAGTGGELGDPLSLFGPRGLAIDLDGNLLVADTGNKRIVRYSPSGAFVDQVGGGGVIEGRFDEPTGVAVDPSDGSIYVADAWNRRIQKFDATLAFVAEWPVPGWESREIFHKPSLAVTAGGDVYATDPQFYRVFVYGRDGTLKGTFGRFGAEANRFGMPNGIAADLPGNTILVADADNNRVLAFPPLN